VRHQTEDVASASKVVLQGEHGPRGRVTRGMTRALRAEIDDLAAWLGLNAVAWPEVN
jgi:hypothetical protein